MLGVPDAETLFRLAVLCSLLGAVVAILALDRPRGRWGAHLRSRFVMGLPWGTLVSAGGVLAVYLFVQGGWAHWNAPVTIPFRAWSYFYPLGMATAAFAHSGSGHLIGNLVGTLVLAPIAEYAWGHFPRERGVQTFTSPLTNPYVRAFVVFPAAVVAVGLFTAFFALGPVIGFSGVVFAFAGFALVRYPIVTVVAVVAGNTLRTLYGALQNPTISASAGPSYSSPWWADIAIQGHAIGLLAGFLLGVWVLRGRGDDRPSAARVAIGVVLFGVAQSLWAVYWYRGGETYVLYRAAGLALVVLLATLVAATVATSASPLIPVPDRPDAVRAVPRWRIGATVLLLCTAALAGPAVPVNLTTTTSDDLPSQSDPIQVRGYEVTYAENVPNGMVSIIDVEAFGETTQVNTSGVIVRNRERGIWMTAVSKGRLDFTGTTFVRVGGVGWRETVRVERRGWNAIGGGTVYKVNLVYGDRNVTAFTSAPVQADPVVAGRNVSVEAAPAGFRLNVSLGNRSATGPIPAVNETTSIGGLEFTNSDGRIYAINGATRVRVAQAETYN
ncbi:rhomboid family intramembrane serine protease [Haloplanus aerogenes]|uniref:Membrane associated rhomboid family serine protease n=1 Tax=Haloplanus aerogenes TaxID=660522 RepID=A0A3M0DTQ5_9EURY|nr:rhomboid family intramembrane serine protease [Haloplanus aerogenes]AZH25678.1 rhomboid family intramembrane serine protease [Haloplanus aerogenes]RMB25409.1 membrane associated rhomboid family serine protease [Haloplanus aerogenes]